MSALIFVVIILCVIVYVLCISLWILVADFREVRTRVLTLELSIGADKFAEEFVNGPKDEPQTDWNETLPCHKCESALSSECTACDGQQYFRTEEGETDCPWK